MSELYSFYRPHERVQLSNEQVDPVTGEVTSLPSMTKQSFVAECDINNILKQYKLTGMVSHINAKAQSGAYLDLPDETDFQSALETVIRAEESFATLPSKLRTRFNNDPAEFLEFMADPRNQDEAIELGLATRREDAEPTLPLTQPTPPSPTPEPSPPDSNRG